VSAWGEIIACLLIKYEIYLKLKQVITLENYRERERERGKQRHTQRDRETETDTERELRIWQGYNFPSLSSAKLYLLNLSKLPATGTKDLNASAYGDHFSLKPLNRDGISL